MLQLAPDDPDRLLDEIGQGLLAQVSERETELAALLGEAEGEGKGDRWGQG